MVIQPSQSLKKTRGGNITNAKYGSKYIYNTCMNVCKYVCINYKYKYACIYIYIYMQTHINK